MSLPPSLPFDFSNTVPLQAAAVKALSTSPRQFHFPPLQQLEERNLESWTSFLTPESPNALQSWPPVVRLDTSPSPANLILDPILRKALGQTHRQGSGTIEGCPFKDPGNDAIIPKAVGPKSPFFLEPKEHDSLHAGLQAYFDAINWKGFRKHWEGLLEAEISQWDDLVNIQERLSFLVCEMILSSVLGMEPDQESIGSCVEAILNPDKSGFIQRARIIQMRYLIRRHISAQRKHPEIESQSCPSLIGILVQLENLSDELILDTAATILIHSVSNLAPLLAFSLKFIADCSHLQRKALAAYRTPSEKKRKKWLEAFWQEILRYVGASIRPRRSDQVLRIDTDRGFFHLPANEIVDVYHGLAGHHPGIIEDPEHFLPEIREGNASELLLLFGIGPHCCVGPNLAYQFFSFILPAIIGRLQLNPVCLSAPQTVYRRRVEELPEMWIACYPRESPN